MDDSSKEIIKRLEGDIIDLKFDLENCRRKELIYLDILNNIQTSIDDFFKMEEENERFKLGEEINFKEGLINLNNSLKEYKRIYKIRF